MGYNPHKCGAASYHPLLAFCAETKEILQGWLRSGDVYTGNGVVEFMRQLLAHLPNRTRILFRGDSGFFAEKLLDYLDDRDQDYLIKAKFKGLRLLLETKQWTRIKANHDWESTEFTHQCGTWSSSRKFVAVRREKEIGDMAEAIKKVCEDSVYRQKLAQGGPKHTKKYNWNSSFKKHMDLFETVLS